MNGFLNLLKPPGMTSSNAVVRIRKTLPRGVKVGHAGTLDPEAAGVLPIMIGRATRLFEYLADKQKEYVAEIAPGASTDTQDATGRVLARSDTRPTEAALRAILPRFTGEIEQLPPAYSALKVQGMPAYALARKGVEAALAPRRARVDLLEIIEPTPHGWLLRVVCGRGVYVRTLCHDIGAALSCPSHMRFLLRARSGVFSISDAVTIEEWDESRDEALLLPLDAPLFDLPAAHVDAQYTARCRNGNALTDFDAEPGFPAYRVYCGDQFAGIGHVRDGSLRFDAALME